MARELLLMRHGKSAWPLDVADYNRPLKKRGRKAALAIGEWLLASQQVPDWIVSSQADRARETAEKVCKGLRLNPAKHLIFDDRIYEAGPEELKQVLADCPGYKSRVLLIGHNPGLDQLLLALADQPPPLDQDGKILGTAHLARLSLPDDWQQLGLGCGQLRGIIRPADLPDAAVEITDPESQHQSAELVSDLQPAKSRRLIRAWLQRLVMRAEN